MIESIQSVAKLVLASHATSFWPLLVVPALVYALSRPVLAALCRMDPRNHSAARLAFCASITPGLAFVGLTALTLKRFDFQMVLHPWASWGCFAHCFGLASIFLAVPLRAAILLHRRYRAASGLLALAENPSPRLAAFQTELQVPIRELPASEPACFLAGLLHPVVCVSRGALAVLRDEELRAALLHERAHWRRRETLRASLAMFLNECSVLPVRAALNQYRRCAEFLADRDTLKHAHPVTLASALLSFARFSVDSSLAVHLAGQTTADRVALLLGVESPAHEKSLDKAYAALLLVAAASLALTPFWIRILAGVLCGGHG